VGSVISPLLANIYLHHAFDEWMSAKFPTVPFERYADDIVVHCKSKAQAEHVLDQIATRLRQWKLELHPEKTRIVYCKDSNRTGSHTHEEFDFLAFTFRARKARNTRDGRLFRGFLPAIGKKAKAKISNEIREWKLQKRTDLSITKLAELGNATVRGWCNYFEMYYPGEFQKVLRPINLKLLKWTKLKYRKNARDAWAWLRRICRRQPELFAHWQHGLAIS
jgi:hypothetical protein